VSLAHLARRFFGALRHVPFRRVTFRAVTSGRDDRPRRDKQPRPGNDCLLHRLLQTNVRVTRAFGAKIAQRRKAGEQRAAQMIRRARDAQAQRFARHLIVPDSFTVRMQQDVRVRLDQSGHQS